MSARKSFAESIAKLLPCAKFNRVPRHVLLKAGRFVEFEATVAPSLREATKRKTEDDKDGKENIVQLRSRDIVLEGSGINDWIEKKRVKLVAHSSDVATVPYSNNVAALQEICYGPQQPRTCTICSDEKPWSEFCNLKNCPHIYCCDCMLKLISIKIEEGSVRFIKCPDLGCQQPIDYDDIKKLVPTHVFDRFDELLLEVEVAAMDDVEVCPNKACNMQYVINAVDLSRNGRTTAQCPHCQSVLCLLCKQNFHSEGMVPHVCVLEGDRAAQVLDEYENKSTSAETRLKLEKIYGEQKLRNLCNDRRSEREVEAKKKCPQCKAPCVKDEGCNKVTCTKCSTVWCWICNGKIPATGYKHFNVAGGSRQGGCAGKLWSGVRGRDPAVG